MSSPITISGLSSEVGLYESSQSDRGNFQWLCDIVVVACRQSMIGLAGLVINTHTVTFQTLCLDQTASNIINSMSIHQNLVLKDHPEQTTLATTKDAAAAR